MELIPSSQAVSRSITQEWYHFIEPEYWLPSSEELSTGVYPEPDETTPYHLILSKIHLNITPSMSSSS
jgi:hypothetical protein